MVEDISEEIIRNLLKEVKHPAIDRSLLDLGMVKEIVVKEDKVVITMALPFPNIPIVDQLISSIKESLKPLGAEVEIAQTIMSHDEVQKFLTMEQQGWKGSI